MMLSLDDRNNKEAIENLEKFIQGIITTYKNTMPEKMFIDRGFKKCLDDNIKELDNWYSESLLIGK